MLHLPIAKATFKFSNNKKWQGGDIPVMINPSEIIIKLENTDQFSKKITMELIFDLVEQYEKAVQDDKHVYYAIAGDEDFTDDDTSVGVNNIHVYNTNLCCYKSLYNAFNEGDAVKFSWGTDIEIIGKISEIYSNFSYFSSTGDPLRAVVNLTITKEDVGLD